MIYRLRVALAGWLLRGTGIRPIVTESLNAAGAVLAELEHRLPDGKVWEQVNGARQLLATGAAHYRAYRPRKAGS